MSTHNIGFYEDLTKIVFQLSSNIIKYALYELITGPSVLRTSDRSLSDQLAAAAS